MAWKSFEFFMSGWISSGICNCVLFVIYKALYSGRLKVYSSRLRFMISIISAGVTTKSTLGKCLMLPVTKNESSFDKATS